MHKYRIKTIKALIVMMLVLLMIFFVTLYDQYKGKAIFDIGLGYTYINYITMTMCTIAIIKAVVEITRVEHKAEYETRIKNRK